VTRKIKKARGRSVAEWIGKTPDSRPPPHVLLRIFDRYKGKCHISGAPIGVKDKWQAEHIKRVEDGGENRESNLAPALIEPHKLKTKEETKRGKKADRARMKHVGVEKRKAEIAQRPKEEKPPAKALPPRRGGIYARFFGGEK
jgi:5-methylcytosine-specific restriction enzyme A